MNVLEAQQQSLEQQLESRAMRGDKGAAQALKELRAGKGPQPEEVTEPAPSRAEELTAELEGIAQAALDGDEAAVTRAMEIRAELAAIAEANELEAAASRQATREAAKEKRERDAEALREATAEYDNATTERKRSRVEAQEALDHLLAAFRRINGAWVTQSAAAARVERLGGGERFAPSTRTEERSLTAQLKGISESVSMDMPPIEGPPPPRLNELP